MNYWQYRANTLNEKGSQMKKKLAKPFRSARFEVKHRVPRAKPSVAEQSSAYQLAFIDHEFLLREELRPVRLQLELLKPELIQRDENIESTVVIFGSARIPEPAVANETLKTLQKELKNDPSNRKLRRRVKIAEKIADKSHFYEEARRLAAIISERCQVADRRNFVVVTGGGPGIMEAANRGANDVDAKSIGLNIVLPMEQGPNIYVTPSLTFLFHYFAIRKMHFLIRAKALIVFPGGYGTLDELFEALTLIQTRKIKAIPILLFGREFWSRVINFEVLVEEGTIDARDLRLFQYVDSAEDAWMAIKLFYKL